MKRQFAFLLLAAAIIATSVSANAQSTNPITLTVSGGLTTSQLAVPTPLSLITTCPGTANTWNYSVVAVDAAGGTTNAAVGSISTATACTTLNTTNYNAITSTAVVGSVTCYIYRAAGPGSGTQGYIAHVACGATYLDQSMPTPMSPVPVANSTGSVYGTTMTAQAFTAGSGSSGAGAGTDIMMSGSALSSCPGTSGSISCIPVNGAFFQEAANGFGGSPSLGITWPTSLASSISGTFTGPFLFSAATGSPLTSQVAVGSLSDSADPMLATALAPFTDQSLAILSKNGSTGYDVASSTIVLSGGKIPNVGLVNSAVTFNGQSVSLGLTGNVNAGNVAHTVSLNEGNGAQLGATGVDTTTTHALFAGASDPGFRAIASGDLPTIPIAGGGTNTTTASPGTMLNATSGTASTWTSTPTLGATGVFGSLTMGNSSSGLLTLEPVTGALTTSVIKIPAGTDTLVDLAGTQTLTNKSIAASEVNSGTLGCAQMPALTGDTTSSSGACATTTSKVNGVSYSAGPGTNTVPVVTGASTTTYEAVPNTALANSGLTVPVTSPLSGGGAVSLGGSTASITCTTCAIGPGTSLANEIATFSSTDGVTLSDSGIASFAISSGSNASGIFIPSIINPLSAGASQTLGTTIKLIQFINPYKITVGHISANVINTGSSFSLGIYNASGTNLISATSISCTPSGVVSSAVSSVTLQPGVYYFAYLGTDTACSLAGTVSTASNAGFLNKNSSSAPRIGTITGSSLPVSFTPSAVTAAPENVVFGYIEP
jgi:hypothetical protein